MRKTFLGHRYVCFALMVVVGCASPPSAEQVATAEYGTAISQLEAETAAKAYLRGIMKDPGSIQTGWAPVNKGFFTEAPLDGGRTYYGWQLIGSVNAKNSYGGYTGAREYRFVFHDGKIIAVVAQRPNSRYMKTVARNDTYKPTYSSPAK